jgi:type II secretory pathway component PulK
VMMCAGQETTTRSQGKRNDRGVALLIVLLVTALLIALIFEFSYATRISLNSAINFRDSQRAYFLARSGIYAFIKYGDQLRDYYIQQSEWGVVPLISDGDTQVRIMWEDEQGKINIKGTLNDANTLGWLTELLTIQGVNQEVLNRMVDEKKQIALLSELHQIMSDEEFGKVNKYLTVSASGKINVNTAPEAVLQSMKVSNPSFIVSQRAKNPFKEGDPIPGTTDVKTQSGSNITNFLGPVASNTYTVYAYATVGGYTKQIEAIVNVTDPLRPAFYYWRSL